MVAPLSHTESIKSWRIHLRAVRPEQNAALIDSALDIIATEDPHLIKQSIEIADLLLQLEMDTESLTAATIYLLFKNNAIHADLIAEKFGDRIQQLLNNAVQMRNLEKLQYHSKRESHQKENLRKMLLAMVTDVRAVILILAEKVVQLRAAKTLDLDVQKKLADKCLDIYAPLANRLGIWQIKWELEDLSLRYIEPDTYKTIAKALETKRAEREAYIIHTKEVIKELLQKQSNHPFQITGRVKHIYSIYNKMKRKNADFKEIYDISAFRILVPSIEDCYKSLSVLTNQWDQIPEEFDDYITQPKANGYQSIHIVLYGPEQRVIEVQIRTHDMHHESEIGIASHWQYKEGGKEASVYEEKIALLRQIMAWENEVLNREAARHESPVQDLFADRVYVFTPAGDIIDLPKGATPIDFAYHIHSEVGHRCRGAKILGRIVPLTYQLQTGDRVEILTAKAAHPSRDWLMTDSGYIKTSKARQHIQHWFRLQDPDSHKEDIKLEPVKRAHAQPRVRKSKLPEKTLTLEDTLKKTTLVTKIAACCHPRVGDQIIGYITKKNLISIHKQSCRNISYLREKFSERFIDINEVS